VLFSIPFTDVTLTYLQYLPLLVNKLEKLCEENGLRNDSIVMRMTGCPNGCARPYVAGEYHDYFIHALVTFRNFPEVAFVGKAPGTYSMLLGGGYYGQRMNKIYRGMSSQAAGAEYD
jgi:sulfite reductase (NADPH) hemoprotein beta-component